MWLPQYVEPGKSYKLMAVATPDAASLRCAAELLAAASRHLDAGSVSEACRLVECADGVLWYARSRYFLAKPKERPAVIFKPPRAETSPQSSPPPSPLGATA